MSKQHKEPILGITIGDINGIGPEVIIKAFYDSRILDYCTVVLYGSARVINYYKKSLNLDKLKFNSISNSSKIIHKSLNIINCWETEEPINPGKNELNSGKLALLSINAALEDLHLKKIDGLITAPINKSNIKLENELFNGHTGYIAKKLNEKNELMLMCNDELRIATLTGHVSVKEIEISFDKIVTSIQILTNSLKRDFGIDNPKIGVLGLNPHAGDNGVIGKEETEVIYPAIKKMKENGIFVFGPYSADAYFGSKIYQQFDATLAMYHDQGLIPFKTLSFGNGVNYTAGLSIVRTSPDHGTAFDIAGKNKADESSFRQAIYTCIDIIRQRKNYDEMHANPIEKVKLEREIQPEDEK